MKTTTLTIAFVALIATISCNKKIEKNETNMKEFVNTCIEGAKGQYPGAITDLQIKEYCKCAGEKTLDNFTAAELIKLNAPAQYPELEQKMIKLVEPCINEYLLK